ncbi:hypothetical protein EDD22DRAFT_959163 [Suillus occidentalis]|nr:hypothetical protein EDD22DRAFT_959163 [Suillus occidentalis]
MVCFPSDYVHPNIEGFRQHWKPDLPHTFKPSCHSCIPPNEDHASCRLPSVSQSFAIPPQSAQHVLPLRFRQNLPICPDEKLRSSYEQHMKMQRWRDDEEGEGEAEEVGEDEDEVESVGVGVEEDGASFTLSTTILRDLDAAKKLFETIIDSPSSRGSIRAIAC